MVQIFFLLNVYKSNIQVRALICALCFIIDNVLQNGGRGTKGVTVTVIFVLCNMNTNVYRMYLSGNKSLQIEYQSVVFCS